MKNENQKSAFEMANRIQNSLLGLSQDATHREVQEAMRKRDEMFSSVTVAQKLSLGLSPNATHREVQEAMRKRDEMFSSVTVAQKLSLGLSPNATHREVQEAMRQQDEKFSSVSAVYKLSLGLSSNATHREVQEAMRKRDERFASLSGAYKTSLGLPPNATHREVQETMRKRNPMAGFAGRTQRAMLGLPENATQSDVRRALDRQQHFLGGVGSALPSMDNLSASAFASKGTLKGINDGFSFRLKSDQNSYAKSVADDWKVSSAAVTGRNLFKLNSSMRVFESRAVRNSYAHGIAITENHAIKSPVLGKWLSATNTSNPAFVKSVQEAVEWRQSESYEESRESISTDVEVAATKTFIQDVPDSGDKLEVTSEELYELQDLLAKNSTWKACHLPVAERIHEYFSSLKVKRQKINTPLYHGRSRKAKVGPYVENELNTPALYGMPSHGRFNGENENLYYTSDNVEALKSELKLEKDEVYDAIEFEPNHEFGVVDLTLESQVLMSFCLQRVAASQLNTPVEYFIPTYIMQCLRDNPYVDVVRVKSAVSPDTINYIFLDISMRRDANVNRVKMHRFLGKFSEKTSKV